MRSRELLGRSQTVLNQTLPYRVQPSCSLSTSGTPAESQRREDTPHAHESVLRSLGFEVRSGVLKENSTLLNKKYLAWSHRYHVNWVGVTCSEPPLHALVSLDAKVNGYISLDIVTAGPRVLVMMWNNAGEGNIYEINCDFNDKSAVSPEALAWSASYLSALRYIRVHHCSS